MLYHALHCRTLSCQNLLVAHDRLIQRDSTAPRTQNRPRTNFRFRRIEVPPQRMHMEADICICIMIHHLLQDHSSIGRSIHTNTFHWNENTEQTSLPSFPSKFCISPRVVAVGLVIQDLAFRFPRGKLKSQWKEVAKQASEGQYNTQSLSTDRMAVDALLSVQWLWRSKKFPRGKLRLDRE